MNSFKIFKNSSLISKYLHRGLYTTSKFYFADPMKSKEVAEEKFFFDKEERKALRSLLSKLNAERTEENIDDSAYLSRERLKSLLETYKVEFSKELVEELIKWKKEQKH